MSRALACVAVPVLLRAYLVLLDMVGVVGTAVCTLALVPVGVVLRVPAATYVALKVVKYGAGLRHMLLSSETRWGSTPDAGHLSPGGFGTRKRVVFVRHCESTWNEVFNRGFGPAFPFRLLSALFRELFLLAAMDSVFLDAPLSSKGMDQAAALCQHLEEAVPVGGEVDRCVKVLRGDPDAPTSVVVASNLRRAMETAAIGLTGRRKRRTAPPLGDGRFLVHSSLQEMARNIDTHALASAGTVPQLPSVQAATGEAFDPVAAFDAEYNAGNKGVGSKGIQRMDEFCRWVAAREEDYVVAVGHSLWFRNFFRAYMPKASGSVAKKKKMRNAAAVAFTLSEGTRDGRKAYAIDPESVTVVYLGFEGKGK